MNCGVTVKCGSNLLGRLLNFLRDVSFKLLLRQSYDAQQACYRRVKVIRVRLHSVHARKFKAVGRVGLVNSRRRFLYRRKLISHMNHSPFALILSGVQSVCKRKNAFLLADNIEKNDSVPIDTFT